MALVLFPARAFLPQVAASSPPGQELHSSRRIAPNLHGNCSGIARELLWIPHAIILPLLTFSSWFPPPPPSLSASLPSTLSGSGGFSAVSVRFRCGRLGTGLNSFQILVYGRLLVVAGLLGNCTGIALKLLGNGSEMALKLH